MDDDDDGSCLLSSVVVVTGIVMNCRGLCRGTAARTL